MDGVIENLGEVGRMNFRRGANRRPGQRPPSIPRAPAGKVVNAFPYYSAVRFQTDITTSGSPVTYTYRIPQGSERRAFGYAIGDNIAGGVAGFPVGFSATPLETNLIQRSQTNAGENLLIQGISCYVTADSDPMLAALLMERLSVQIALNGDSQLVRLGRMSFLPGGGGLHGAGHSRIMRPGMGDQTSIFSVATNGLPGRENYFNLPYPIAWKSAGKADSNLVLLAKAEREVVISATSRAAATGVEAWTPPAAAAEVGTYCDIVFKLLTTSVSARSVNG